MDPITCMLEELFNVVAFGMLACCGIAIVFAALFVGAFLYDLYQNQKNK